MGLFASFLGYNPCRDSLVPRCSITCLVAAGTPWLRGGRYHHREEPVSGPAPAPAPREPARR